MERSQIRLLVVSPLASMLGTTFLGAEWADVQVATSPDHARATVTAERPRFDVVLVDLMWNTFEDEWTFDGLDVLDVMAASGRGEPALLACQGHGFERDHLEEGRHHPVVRATVLKSNPPSVVAAIEVLAAGGSHHDEHLTSHLRPPEQSLHHWFDAEPRLARVAGAIAAGHGPRWSDIAEVLSMSASNAEKSSDLFRDMLLARGEIGATGDLDKAAVFRWCGEHAHFILSWCRRHAARHRVLRDLPPGVFDKRLTIS